MPSTDIPQQPWPTLPLSASLPKSLWDRDDRRVCAPESLQNWRLGALSGPEVEGFRAVECDGPRSKRLAIPRDRTPRHGGVRAVAASGHPVREAPGNDQVGKGATRAPATPRFPVATPRSGSPLSKSGRKFQVQ